MLYASSLKYPGVSVKDIVKYIKLWKIPNEYYILEKIDCLILQFITYFKNF